MSAPHFSQCRKYHPGFSTLFVTLLSPHSGQVYIVSYPYMILDRSEMSAMVSLCLFMDSLSWLSMTSAFL